MGTAKKPKIIKIPKMIFLKERKDIGMMQFRMEVYTIESGNLFDSR